MRENERAKPKKKNKDALLTERALERAHARKKQRSRRRLLLIMLILLLAVLIVAAIKFAGRGNTVKPSTTNTNAPQDTAIPQESENEHKVGFESNQTDGVTLYTEEYPESTHLTLGLKGQEVTRVKEGDPYIESGAFCIDDRTGPITDYIIHGNVDTSAPGVYTVSYTFESNQAKGSIQRVVNVIPENEFVENKNGIPVLMYHYVYTESDQPDYIDGNWILDKDLEEQLSYLVENDYYFPSMSELRAYIERRISLPEKSAILTFDDAYIGFYEYGGPLLEHYHIPAISFVIGHEEGTLEGSEKIKERPGRYICYESHSYDMHRGGGSIGHGGIISELEVEDIEEDLEKGIKMCGSSDAFAYPFGDVTEDAQEAVENVGIKCAFTTEYDFVKIGQDPTALPRIRVLGDTGLDGFITSLG